MTQVEKGMDWGHVNLGWRRIHAHSCVHLCTSSQPWKLQPAGHTCFWEGPTPLSLLMKSYNSKCPTWLSSSASPNIFSLLQRDHRGQARG